MPGYFNSFSNYYDNSNPLLENDSFYQFSCQVMLIWGCINIPMLMFITAPYGRFYRDGWGLTINGKLGWLIQESVPMIVFWVKWIEIMRMSNTDDSDIKVRTPVLAEWTLPRILFAVMYIGHYVHRTFIYTALNPVMSPTNFTTVSMAVFFNMMNGYIQGANIITNPKYGKTDYSNTKYRWNWSDLKIIIGLFLFFCGMFINIYSDHSFFSQRRQKLLSSSDASKKKKTLVSLPSTSIGDSKDSKNPINRYIIPQGFLFEWITCPNLFGEMIEWIGFAIVTNFSYPGVLFAIFTFSNLFPRALTSHQWIKEKFSEYPKNRKALIPFLI